MHFHQRKCLGLRSNYQKINEHNSRIGEKIQSLRSHQTNLPSPILSRSTHTKQDIIVAPAQTTSRKSFHSLLTHPSHSL